MILAEEIQTTFEIDKSSWTKVKLGDVVREVRGTVKDPGAEGIERIIGLEHLEPENLHIRTWGTLTDGTTFTKVFRKGQVLFGRRRAYLKKAALATFDGICSGDITVLEAKKGLIPELLPFMIQNDKFFELAVKNSAGSLSPRAKFADFADYEFLLPPKEQQEQLAKLLWAGDELIQKEKKVLEMLDMQKLATTESLLTGKTRVVKVEDNESFKDSKFGKIPSSWKVFQLKDIISKARLGGNYANSEETSGLPLIKMGNLSRGFINLDKIFYIPKDIEFDSEDLLNEGDLLFNTRNTLELVGKVAIWKNELPKALYNSNILRMEFKRDIVNSNQFMNLIFNSRKGIQQLRSFATGTTSVAAIYTPELMRFCCAIPSLVEQERIVEIVEHINYSIDSCQSKISSSKSVHKSLISQIF